MFGIINEIIHLILITFIPTLELRLSIPYGLFSGVPASVVIPVVIISNIVLGVVVYFLLNRLTDFFLQFKWFSRVYYPIIEKTHKRTKKYVDKYGFWGIALFIAIPLPGSGSYTGALAAYVLGMKFKYFAIANLIGVIIAGTLVSLGTLGFISIL